MKYSEFAAIKIKEYRHQLSKINFKVLWIILSLVLLVGVLVFLFIRVNALQIEIWELKSLYVSLDQKQNKKIEDLSLEFSNKIKKYQYSNDNLVNIETYVHKNKIPKIADLYPPPLKLIGLSDSELKQFKKKGSGRLSFGDLKGFENQDEQKSDLHK
ncbi:hypothetical protein BH10BAC5_BH10BAC5_25330 [soil metagenome]